MHVEELWSREKAKVKGEQDGVRLMRGEWCAKEDDEEEDGGNGKGDGQDEREEGRL